MNVTFEISNLDLPREQIFRSEDSTRKITLIQAHLIKTQKMNVRFEISNLDLPGYKFSGQKTPLRKITLIQAHLIKAQKMNVRFEISNLDLPPGTNFQVRRLHLEKSP